MLKGNRKKAKVTRREISPEVVYKRRGTSREEWAHEDPETVTVAGKPYYHYRRVSTRRGVFSLLKKLRKMGYKAASFDVPRYITWESLGDPDKKGLRWVVDHAVYTFPPIQKRGKSILKPT